MLIFDKTKKLTLSKFIFIQRQTSSLEILGRIVLYESLPLHFVNHWVSTSLYSGNQKSMTPEMENCF